VDPCCGAGTLLTEAERIEPTAELRGFDLDPEALRAARINGAGSASITVDTADAGDLPLPADSVDRILCNPPWGAQVDARGLLATEPSRWWSELGRVLTPDGAAVLLLPDTAVLPHAIGAGLVPTHIQQVSLSGAHPCIVRLTPG